MPTSVRSRIWSLGIVLLLLAMLATSACSDTSETSNGSDSGNRASTGEPTGTATEESSTETPSTEPAQMTTVRVYLIRGEELGVASREVTDTPATARAAMEALLSGPTDTEAEFGLGTIIPEGTALLGVDIADSIATVDLTPEFASGGGSASMLLRTAQVVYTLTQFSTVTSVNFAIDGEPADYLGGEGLAVVRVSRDDFTDQLPAILVESPTPGQEVGSPVTIQGIANTFEDSFTVNVTDPDGLIIADQDVNYGGGTGTHGSFRIMVPFETAREGLGAVIVFEKSAKDGSPFHVIEVPVRLTQ